MKTRRSSNGNMSSEGQPTKRTRRESVMTPTKGSKAPDEEEFAAWSPVRIVRISEV